MFPRRWRHHEQAGPAIRVVQPFRRADRYRGRVTWHGSGPDAGVPDSRGKAMNIEPPFIAAAVLAWVTCVATTRGWLRRCGIGVRFSPFVGSVSAGGSRLHEMGRQDVYLLCLGALLPCGKHSLQ